VATNTQNHSPMNLRIRRCNSIPLPPTFPNPLKVGAGYIAGSYLPPLILAADLNQGGAGPGNADTPIAKMD
jgi:hypothetical protein